MRSIDRPMMWSDPPPGAGTSGGPRFRLPAGTVTFLMSDIAGSTRLWSAFPETMGSAVDEVYEIIDRAVTQYDGVRPVEQLGKTLRPYSAADVDQVSNFSDRALTAARAAGEPTTEALAQCFLAGLEVMGGNPHAAIARLQPARARMVSAGAGLGLGMIEPYLALARAAVGEIDEARGALETLVATGMDFGFLLSNAIVNLAEILRVGGQAVVSQARANEALAIAEPIHNVPTIAFAKEISGRLAAGREQWTEAERLLHDALALRVEHRILLNLPQTFDALAEVATGLESYEEATRVLGAAQRARADLGLERWRPDRPRFVQLEEDLRTALGEVAFEAALSSGAALSADEAVAWSRRARGDRKRPARGWESLTPTEIRVVELVAEGLTNPQIGERMFISRGTVRYTYPISSPSSEPPPAPSSPSKRHAAHSSHKPADGSPISRATTTLRAPNESIPGHGEHSASADKPGCASKAGQRCELTNRISSHSVGIEVPLNGSRHSPR